MTILLGIPKDLTVFYKKISCTNEILSEGNLDTLLKKVIYPCAYRHFPNLLAGNEIYIIFNTSQFSRCPPRFLAIVSSAFEQIQEVCIVHAFMIYWSFLQSS